MKVVPFTPSAGVLKWVNDTLPLGEYLIGSMRNGGAHGRYGKGDWTFPKCREHMTKQGQGISRSLSELQACHALLFSWKDFYIRLTGLRRDSLIHAVLQLVQWWVTLLVLAIDIP